MHCRVSGFLVVAAVSASVPAWQPAQAQGAPPVILAKGAWSSASDSMTPLPEGGSIVDNVYTSKYFGLSYPLPADWFQPFQGPPPSDGGRYVLAHIRPAD